LRIKGDILLIDYTSALHIIKSKVSVTTQSMKIPLLDSIKHISAHNIYATHSLPKRNISLKDGYGIRVADIGKQAVLKNNIQKLEDGFCYELSTGDSIKEGTQAIVPFEDIQTKSAILYLPRDIEEDQFIKKAGEDIQEGELLLKRGEYIKASHITSLASQGINPIKVFKRPNIAILSIGDNLTCIEDKAKDDEIYNSNALSLAARILEIGAKITQIEKCQNNQASIISILKELVKESDFIITTGAMSRHDAMSNLIYKDDFDILFHKVKIAPASPTALTYFESTPILHLPGLPLSAQLGFELLGVPLLKIIKHENISDTISFEVKNIKEFTSKESCTAAIPGFFDGTSFLSAPSFGAGMLNVLAKCNGYALIEHKKLIKANEKIKFFPF
jgi:molybdopterin molybdotransferase